MHNNNQFVFNVNVSTSRHKKIVAQSPTQNLDSNFFLPMRSLFVFALIMISSRAFQLARVVRPTFSRALFSTAPEGQEPMVSDPRCSVPR